MNGEQEHNRPTRNPNAADNRLNHGGGRERTAPRRKSGRVEDAIALQLCRYWLQGQRAARQLAAIAVSLNSSAGLGGSGRGRGRGYTEKGEDYTPRGGGWKSETLPA